MVIKHKGQNVYVNIYTLGLASTHFIETGFDYWTYTPSEEMVLDVILEFFNFKELEKIDDNNTYHTMGTNQTNALGNFINTFTDHFKLPLPDENTPKYKVKYDYEKLKQ
jgi:spore coat polysaccharide biosynthesis protein SpsF (cytidylyltransferase family)